MIRETPIGLGAGLAAAALMLAPLGGSVMGVVLMIFAALPITLVTLGWGYRAGLIAAVSAMVLLGAVLDISDGLSFGMTIALPAWGLAYLAIADRRTADEERGRIPLGTLVVVAALLSAAIVLIVAIAYGTSYADIVSRLERTLTESAHVLFGIPKEHPLVIPDVEDAAAFLRLLSYVALPVSAFSATIGSLCGLWLSARIARISGRLPRPWPDVAALRLPWWALALLAGGGLVSMLPDIYGLAGQLLLAAMIAAFSVQGFAVVHFVTRGRAARPMLLAIVYLLCFVMSWFAFGALAVVGVLDLIFNLRRLSGSGGWPRSPQRSM